MHITNQKLSCDIFTVEHLQPSWNILNILMIFGIKEKSIILTHTVSVLLSTATNITVRLVTGFVVQSHVLFYFYDIF